jgi:hypothetical protein
LTQVIFWWHPVVWWARHELEVAEEECCDAWVVERQAGVPRLYAEALLATIDFLCAEPLPLPPAACGLGDVPFLRARLTQIIKGRLAAQLSPAAKTAVFLASLFVLPLYPALFGATVSTGAVLTIGPADVAPAVETIEAAPALPQPQIPAAPAAIASGESPTVQAVAALLKRPQRPAELYATAVSPDKHQYRLEVRTGYQVTLVRLQNADNPRVYYLSAPLIKCASFSPDEQMFAAGHDNGEVKLYDCQSGGHDRTLKGAPAAICSVAYSPDGSRVAAGTADGSVIAWDVATKEMSILVDSRSVPASLPVSCLRWSPTGDRLAVALGDFSDEERATLLICAANDGRILAQYALAKPAAALVWQAGGEALLIADWSGAAGVWRIADGQVLDQIQLNDRKSLWGANWSPDCPLE